MTGHWGEQQILSHAWKFSKLNWIMPLTTNSALEVASTWSWQLGQRFPEIPFNHDYSMTSARMHRCHCAISQTSPYTWQVATHLRWKIFCLVSYHINGNAAYYTLSRLKKQKIQNFALLQALYVLGQILYLCRIISEQLQFRTKHIMTLLNASNCCAFSPFLPQTRMLSLNWRVTHCQHLPVAADSQVKIERLLREALSSKICITSPNFQEMRALL